ncbi:LCP family protein [Streptomyces sp. TP-A0874]|uniref:LCP family protein n=1 Tax=Streptomyces sp. TP-A0874 TaxID=549819 RepID=UPI000853404A|nr:LCP family protein [Streptomyces sp. TP-A0874]
MTGSQQPASARHPGGGKTRSRRRRRSRGRTAAAIAISTTVLLTAGVGWVYLRLNGNITTFDADGISGDRPPSGEGGQNVLVIGSDSRSGGNGELGGGDGDVGRSDTAFLLHVHGDRKHAVAVSIPRDTLVDIPRCALPDGTWSEPQTAAMFNSAFSVGLTPEGNPACTQNTVEQLTGLRVDHTVVVDFEGFAEMTSAVGDVPVCLPQDVYEGDINPNLGSRGQRVFKKGQQSVSGQKALDYVRVRYGIGDGSDIGRIQRQQAFVASLVKKIKSQGFNPTTLLPLADAATRSLTVDPGLGSADKLLSFAMSLKEIDLHDTKFVTVPWRYRGARVEIVQPEADALWAALKADRTIDGEDARGGNAKSPDPSVSAPVSGEGVEVSVHNGTMVEGLAGRAAEELRGSGFSVSGTGNAASQDHTDTLIEHGPGEQERAESVARLFPGARLRQTAAPGITVTVGSAYADSPATGGTAPGTAAPDDPSGSSGGVRSADDDLCSDISYG